MNPMSPTTFDPEGTQARTRTRLGIAALYLTQIAVCIGVLVSLEIGNCKECVGTSIQPMLAVTGLFAYSAALALHCIQVLPVNRWFAPAAAGIHALLIAEMIRERSMCVYCIVSALIALALLAAEWPRYSGVRRCIAVLAIVAIGAFSAWARPVLRMEEALFLRPVKGEGIIGPRYYELGRLNVLVVVKKDCPYCEQFRNSYEKTLKDRFGPNVRIAYVPLKNATVISGKLPMIIIGKDPPGSVVIEGLPSLEMISRVVGLRI
jgi:hypothetical protein